MSSSANILALASATQSVSSVAQGYTQSSAIKAKGEYEASIYDSNARLAELQAGDTIRKGEKDALKVRRQTRRMIGSQRAAMAAQGIDIGEGSAIDVIQDTAELGAEDEMAIKNNAWRAAWGMRTEANEYRSRGRFARMGSRREANMTLLTGGMRAAAYGLEAYGHYQGGKEPKKRAY